MNISNATAKPIQAENVAAEDIARNKALGEEEKVAELSRQFEALLLRQILNQAKQPVFGGGATKPSNEHAIYDDLVTAQMADKISATGKIGFAKALQKELSVQLGAKGKTNKNSTEATHS